MKPCERSVFTPEVMKRINTVVGKIGRDFLLDHLRLAEVKNNIMDYLWRNARYYNPKLSEWRTFAGMVVTSGAKRERARLAEEERANRGHVPVDANPNGDDALPLPDPRGSVERLVFAIDLADVLARMPARTAAILHAVVVEGMTFCEAADRFGHARKAFYKKTWPRVRKDFLSAGGEFFLER